MAERPCLLLMSLPSLPRQNVSQLVSFLYAFAGQFAGSTILRQRRVFLCGPLSVAQLDELRSHLPRMECLGEKPLVLKII